ncbi:DUF4328 domain-containing protein [Streptomyces sp. NBC_01264]|uniref:DUF4328 domain-containing protein n=1 Tax=Streptomyces sp. NBC_01264 TaxID=2903804 RepID=UPI002259F604|nr:DUF4328 domain-containing protein [Streptomyces sp. NBC_01264]MCX4782537.1 DUF4328 domain-containing protein [Streptomyces sp. NBC_01264]
MSLSTPGPSPSPPSPEPYPQPYPYPYPPAAPTPVLGSPQGAATAATALLWVVAGLYLLSAAFNVNEWLELGRVLADPVGVDHSGMASTDYLRAFTGLAQDAAMLATAIVFLVWFHRVRGNGQVFRPDGFSQSAGWAIGGWFVPIANLFLPYRTAREIWDASAQNAPDGSFRRVPGTPVVAWWLTVVLACALSQFAAWKELLGETTEAARDAHGLGVFADLATVTAAVLAVGFVRKLTAMQHRKALQGPNAAV